MLNFRGVRSFFWISKNHHSHFCLVFLPIFGTAHLFQLQKADLSTVRPFTRRALDGPSFFGGRCKRQSQGKRSTESSLSVPEISLMSFGLVFSGELEPRSFEIPFKKNYHLDVLHRSFTVRFWMVLRKLEALSEKEILMATMAASSQTYASWWLPPV